MPTLPWLLLLVLVLTPWCLPPATCIAARIFAARCWARTRGSSCWERSHQTVAFCLRMRATYEVGEPLDPLEREEVDRRGMEALVEIRCMFGSGWLV